jgi:hypothetical protein
VGLRAFIGAIANPVDSLRYENASNLFRIRNSSFNISEFSA